MSLEIPGVIAPKLIKGSTGPYWQTAAGTAANGEPCEFYMKYKFEPGTAVINGNQQSVDVLQGNILYIGPQFDIPDPWEHIETRPYMVNDKPVNGHIVGKFWVPMGEFQKAFKVMHEYARDVITPEIDKAVEALYAAAGAKPLMTQAELWNLLMDGLDKDSIRLPPKLFINAAYSADQKAQKKLMAEKYEHLDDES